MSGKIKKCAVYTRKSTEHGLELEFNSLDAQREACEAYIKSQTAEGWQLVPGRYEDGAFSGGNLDRPALQQLLKDIDRGLIDVIVVYKIDRLTRSLADFAKLVEVFDAKKISFVAITQQFNTTTSMGRLTLNVLLSFAQFERELSSERVRDKIAASRKKGKWTGGSVPLGYDSVDKKLVVNKEEEKTVRIIFDRYLVLRSFQKLVDELNRKGVVSKIRNLKTGTAGGVTFTYGPLAYLLKNRIYIGEIGHKGVWFPGEQEPIIARETFAQVQDLLKTNGTLRTARRHDNKALLTGLLFDDRGNRMSPSFTVKRGARHYSYVSTAILRGRKATAGSLTRIPAREIESEVLKALRQSSEEQAEVNSHADSGARLINKVERIVISAKNITISLKAETKSQPPSIEIARYTATNSKTFSEAQEANEERKIAPTMVHAIARAHGWLRQLSNGTFTNVDDLAEDAAMHSKVVRQAIKLAFLSPDVTRAILNGEIQNSFIAHKIREVPILWSRR